jgi:NADPH:quinone reductase-like Zn-dependent oxidoreductase
MATLKKYRAVKFDRYGGVDVLHIEKFPVPMPNTEQVLVKMRAAGINPGEAAIREGKMASKWPADFPSGQGSDFAGVVEKAGNDVTGFSAGDEVIGFTNERSSQAEYILVGADQLIHRPPGVSWEQAGSLFVAGTTAYAAVGAVAIEPGDTLVVSGAAGGVGCIVVQLARNAGARVIGLASSNHHPWLKRHDITPVEYGEGMEKRIRAAANHGRVDAFIDTFGGGYVDLALELGVAPNRIDTIIDFVAAERHHVRTAGNAEAARPEVMEELAKMIDEGDLEIPIYKVYHLDQVREAYREVAKRHTLGKMVLVP